MGPLIDVCIPTYEPNPEFLRETLDALLAQTEKRWTCLIHDDASTIDVKALVSPYLRDPRFRFARSPKRLGIGGNWNASLGEARRAEPGAPYLQFLFQDDLWHPTYLERAVSILEENPDVGFVASGHRYVCDEPLETAHGYERLYELRKQMLTGGRHNGPMFLQWWLKRGLQPNFIGEPCFVMMRRTLMEDVGLFSEELRQVLDVEYWVRLLLEADWYYIADDLGEFRVHRKAASYTHFLEGADVQEHFTFLEHLRTLFPKGSSEWSSLDASLDQRFADVICHTVNRLLRLHRVGRGAKPMLRYLRGNPRPAFRGLKRYVVQASERWWRKGWAACSMLVHGQSAHAQYPLGGVAALPEAAQGIVTARESGGYGAEVRRGWVHRLRLPIGRFRRLGRGDPRVALRSS